MAENYLWEQFQALQPKETEMGAFKCCQECMM